MAIPVPFVLCTYTIKARLQTPLPTSDNARADKSAANAGERDKSAERFSAMA